MNKNIERVVSRISTIGYKRSNQNNIAMIHIGRSGSTVLAELLNEHRKIFWDNEVYESLMLKRKQDGIIAAADEPGGAVGFLKKRMNQTRAELYGFEVKFFHLRFLNEDLATYLENLKRVGVSKLIVLERKNYLRKIISSLIATQTGLWQLRGELKPQANKVRIDVDHIRIDGKEMSMIEFLDEYQRDFDSLYQLLESHRVLKLTYEDDVYEDPLAAYGKICEFVGIEKEGAVIRLRKTNPFPVADLIENFDAVKSHLANTSYSWMLEA